MTRVAIIVVVGVGWIGVRGHADPGDLLMAFFFGVLVALVVGGRLPPGPRLRRTPAALWALAWVVGSLLHEVVVSNLEQVALILRPRLDLRPHWVEFEPRLESPGLRALLGLMISITPMTIFCDDRQTGGRCMLLHILDSGDVERSVERIRRRMEGPILALEDAWLR